MQKGRQMGPCVFCNFPSPSFFFHYWHLDEIIDIRLVRSLLYHQICPLWYCFLSDVFLELIQSVTNTFLPAQLRKYFSHSTFIYFNQLFPLFIRLNVSPISNIPESVLILVPTLISGQNLNELIPSPSKQMKILESISTFKKLQFLVCHTHCSMLSKVSIFLLVQES